MSTDVAIQRPGKRLLSLPAHVNALAGLAATAGVIHVVATAEHLGESVTLWGFFAIVGVAQLLSGWRIYSGNGDRRLLNAVALGSVGVALLWIFSRTTGLPFGPDAGEVSGIGAADTIATIHELMFAVIVWRATVGDRWLAWLSSGVGIRVTFAFLSMTLFVAALGGHAH